MAVLSTPTGARLPVINRRVNPQDVGMYTIRTDTARTEQSTVDNRVAVIRLYERPLTDYAGTGIVIRDTTTGNPVNASLTFPPNQGTFYTNPYLASVYFNIGTVGNSMSITYTGMGSLVVAEDMNWVYINAKNGAKPMEPSAVSIAAGQTRTFQKVYILAVWEVETDGSYTKDPANIEVKVYNPTDANAYYSIIKNNGAASRNFMYRAVPMQTPEA